MIHNRVVVLLCAAMLLIVYGCKKNTDNYTTLPANSYAMSGNFNGGAFSITNSYAISASSTVSGDTTTYYYVSSGSYSNGTPGDSIDGADIVMYHTFKIPGYPNGVDTITFDTLYTPYAQYKYFNPQTNQNGIRIDITTGAGTQWSTANGTQSGSTFTITSRSSVDQYNRVTITGTFTCTLYDGQGHSRRISNGIYTAYEILQ